MKRGELFRIIKDIDAEDFKEALLAFKASDSTETAPIESEETESETEQSESVPETAETTETETESETQTEGTEAEIATESTGDSTADVEAKEMTEALEKEEGQGDDYKEIIAKLQAENDALKQKLADAESGSKESFGMRSRVPSLEDSNLTDTDKIRLKHGI